MKPRSARNGAPCEPRARRLRRVPAQPARRHPVERSRRGRSEIVHFAAPRSGLLHIDNANGKTRVIGEDRDDIEVRLQKIARAESETAAARARRSDAPHRQRDRRLARPRSRDPAQVEPARRGQHGAARPARHAHRRHRVERQGLHRVALRVREGALQQRRRLGRERRGRRRDPVVERQGALRLRARPARRAHQQRQDRGVAAQWLDRRRHLERRDRRRDPRSERPAWCWPPATAASPSRCPSRSTPTSTCASTTASSAASARSRAAPTRPAAASPARSASAASRSSSAPRTARSSVR